MLHPRKFGIAAGIVWGFCMLFCTILAVYTGYSQQFLELMSTIYIGYSVSLSGALIGLVWGFTDAFIGFFLIAWVYNRL